MTIGPSLPPGLVRNPCPGSNSSDDHRSDSAKSAAYSKRNEQGSREAQPSRTSAQLAGKNRPLGPPLPPDFHRGSRPAPEDLATAQPSPSNPDDGQNPGLGPALPPPSPSTAAKSIGPALPPSLSGRVEKSSKLEVDLPVNARKREWDRVRKADERDESGGGVEREEWMLVPPTADRHAASLLARGFNSGKAAAAAKAEALTVARRGKGVHTGDGVPVRPGDRDFAVQHAEGDGSDSDDAGDHVPSVAKRPRVSDGPSLLQQHREKLAAKPAEGAFKQWDREAEFVVNHKKRDASYYTGRDGGLSSRYGSGSSK